MFLSLTQIKKNQMPDQKVLEWLLEGDVSIQYQTYKHLLGVNKPDLKDRIATEGWGAQFLAKRNKNGHWGRGFYQPKWISSHYTLLDLKHLSISNEIPEATLTIEKILQERKSHDGGVNPGKTIKNSDVCVNGMFLNYASYFKAKQDDLKSIIDFILSQQLPDGGFNCHFNRIGAQHSSLHSTLSVIEGILEYTKNGYDYRLGELQKAEKESREFILLHRLFKSHTTGKIISNRMLKLSWPSRWYYDILKSLDYFRDAGVGYDERMRDAIDILLKKQRKDKTWPLQQKHSGLTHFDMEKTGEPGRWNTLRALRVLGHFGIEGQVKNYLHLESRTYNRI